MVVVERFYLGEIALFSGVFGAGFEPLRVYLGSSIFLTTERGLRLSTIFIIETVFSGDFAFLTETGFDENSSFVGKTTAWTTA